MSACSKSFNFEFSKLYSKSQCEGVNRASEIFLPFKSSIVLMD